MSAFTKSSAAKSTIPLNFKDNNQRRPNDPILLVMDPITGNLSQATNKNIKGGKERKRTNKKYKFKKTRKSIKKRKTYKKHKSIKKRKNTKRN